MKISIIGANGAIGREITKFFLTREELFDELSLITRSRASYKSLVSMVEDSPRCFAERNVCVSIVPHELAGSDVVFFCAGLSVTSPKQTPDVLFEQNYPLLKAYCKKLNTAAPGALIILITNPVSKLIQAVSGVSKNVFAGIGVTNDTLRLRKNFLRKYGYWEKNLYVIGDHLVDQTITLSQIDATVAERVVREEKSFLKKHGENIHSYIKKRNFQLLRRENIAAMFDFANRLPLKFQADARQRFINYITKTVLSTAHAAQELFRCFSEDRNLSSEIVADGYMSLRKSVLGIPVVFEQGRPVAVELDYASDEMSVLKNCSVKYSL